MVTTSMPARPNYWNVMRAAKDEALLAIDFFNRLQGPRTLEAFIVHMCIAWLYLCHATFERDGIDCRYTDKSGAVVLNDDGSPKLWELGKCVERLEPDPNDPARKNIEFFIGLRNTIEHRFRPREFEALRVAIASKAHAFVRNFEDRLVEECGRAESLGQWLRFPVFLSSFSEDALESARKMYARLGAPVRRYIDKFYASLPEEVIASPTFDFRVRLIPKTTAAEKPTWPSTS